MMKMWSSAELGVRTKSRKELDAASGTSTTFSFSPCAQNISGPHIKCFGCLCRGREGCLKVSPTRVLGSYASLYVWGEILHVWLFGCTSV